MSRSPNFFIVGAPKCGTSALYHHIKMHPQIFLATPKELNFFATDLTSPHFSHDPEWYETRFEGVENEQRIGEASVWYLFSEEAAAGIKKYCSDAKIIVMLRNPVDTVRSYHSQRIWNQTEDISDFSLALSAIEDRRQGKRLPKTPYPVETLDYLRVASYPEQLRRYYNLFDKSDVLVIFFDDFIANPMAAFSDVFRFLGVDSTFTPELDLSGRTRNANKRTRSEWIRRLLHAPQPAPIRFIARTFVRNKETRAAIWSRIRRLNTRWQQRGPADEGTRQFLVDHFRSEVEELSDILQVDLLKKWGFEPTAD